MPKTLRSGNPRGRGTYNPACDVCARKKTKCDGNKPTCELCHQGSRACTWSKNSVRKRWIEPHSEAMHKSCEEQTSKWRKYADYLESKLNKCPYHTGELRSFRPPDIIGHLGDRSEYKPDLTSNDGNSDSGDRPGKELCAPTQSLKFKGNELSYHYTHAAQADILTSILEEQSEAQLHRQTTLITRPQSGTSFVPEFAIDSDGSASSSSFSSSKGHGWHHSSFLKHIYSRKLSVNSTSTPPILHDSSLSLDNPPQRIQQDTPSFSLRSSPGNSIPITIQVPSNGDSHFSSNNLSKFFPSFSYPSPLNCLNLPGSNAASPVVGSPNSPYAISTPSASSTFSQYEPNINGYGQAIAHSLSVPDALTLTNSSHTTSHPVHGSSALFGSSQELDAAQSSQPLSAPQVNAQDLAVSGVILIGETLITRPVIGPNFTVQPPSTELIFQFNSPQASVGADGIINYNAPAVFEDFLSNHYGDTAMNDHAAWPIGLEETVHSNLFDIGRFNRH